MVVQDAVVASGVWLFIDPQASLAGLFAWHMPVVLACLWVAFKVRGQNGAVLIMSGVGILLCRQLLLVLMHVESAGLLWSVLASGICLLLFFGTAVLGYGLIGLGIMRPHQNSAALACGPSRWLNAALLTVIAIDLSLLADRMAGPSGTGIVDTWQNVFHVLSLVLLIVVVTVRHVHHSTLSRRAAAGERQLDAMLSMFSAVKHDLNNDMQVVVGNAELAGILIENKGDVRQPVTKITDAANMAIERIEQLSVFSAARDTMTSAVDLNAALRECVTKLSTEVPPIVTLRLELEHLPIRVMADRYLLGLSLTHLIRQAVKTMEHGGEIVVRTRDMSHRDSKPGMAVVNAEVFIVRALRDAEDGGTRGVKNLIDNNRLLKLGLATTKALVERSGAISVGHSMAPNESLINMGFVTETIEPAGSAALIGKESFV